jgi:signal transduction histidine kinase/DNA-binding response OmpR family regulator
MEAESLALMDAPAPPSHRWRHRLDWMGASVAVLAICGILYLRDVRQIDQGLKDREVLRVSAIGRSFTSGFQGVAADLRVLSEDESLQAYLDHGDPAQLDFFARELLHLSRHHPEYDQLRFLDQHGIERVRVALGGGIAPAARLLDRHESPFFAGTMAMARDQIYISAFDLYVNNGRVEQPFKPAIRMSLPVLDSAGHRRGVLVINYLGSYLLNSLRQISAANQHRLRVLNARGYWLHAGNPDDEWGFQIPSRADRTLARTAPELWAQVAAEAEGQVDYHGGWFTWQHVVPTSVVPGSFSAEPFLVVASEFPHAERIAAFANRRQSYLIVTLVMLVIANGGVWFFHARQRERGRAEQALRLANAAAQESARLKAQFLANMSHEIRTPMNGVIGMIDLLLETTLTVEQRSFAQVVRGSAESLLTIINDILDFSKIEAGQLAFERIAFDLNDPVENCLSLLSEKAYQKGIELAYLIEESVPTQLVGDSGRLQQVLLNLVGNALKFTEKGEVVVRVAKVGETGRVIRLRFTVRDTGIGIPAEAQARLFQPFVQADSGTTRKYGGSGLGLAICRQLITLMGGEIGLESVPGQGATFWFTAEFPLQEATLKVVPRPTELAGMRCLVVDDNETNREILIRQLAAWSVSAQAVDSGPAALQALQAAAAAGLPYHFGVLDMEMPGMSGLDLAHAVRTDSRLAAMKLIILSSIGRLISPSELAAAGVGICLTKPARHSQLHEALLGVLAGQRAEPRRAPAAAALAVASDRPPAADVKLRILVVEDNPVNQHVARLQLERFGYAPDIVASGHLALEATAAPDEYDVILMDCQMPELDGIETARRIRAHEAALRREGVQFQPLYIVAMTANAMVGDRESCLAAGMNDYISKPVRAPDLAAALARAQVPAT